MASLLLLLLLLLLLPSPSTSAAAPAPPAAASLDCMMRRLTLEYSAKNLAAAYPGGASDRPGEDAAELRKVEDSLELGARGCAGGPAPTPPPPPPPPLAPRRFPPATPKDGFFVDYAKGNDAAPGQGTLARPFKTVARALAAVGCSSAGVAHSPRSRAVVLREGVHFLKATLELSVAGCHSDLLVTAYCSGAAPCEAVSLSGGVPLAVAGRWEPHDVRPGGANIWKVKLPAAVAERGATPQSALHWLDGGTDDETAVLTRARWPNRHTGEGTIDHTSLLDITASDAVWEQKPRLAQALHKRVATPSIPSNVTGEFNHWMAGVGGECARFTPPVAAICNPNATGGGYNWDAPGPYFPTGLLLGNASKLFPNASKWGDMSQAVLTAWTNGWYTSHFDIRAWESGRLVFGPRGGVQGGRGWHFDASLPGEIKLCTGSVRGGDCGPVKIEGVLAELDAPGEFHIEAGYLYLYYNATATAHQAHQPPRQGLLGTAPPSNRTLVLPFLSQLIALSGNYAATGPARGPPTAPLRNVTLYGLVFRDAAPTFLEPHGIPSGGDWSLQRTAAVFLQGTEGVKVDHCSFKYLGGIGYQLSGYNRNATVLASRFAYLGGSAMTAWGYTSSTDGAIPPGTGIDGTNGNQPHGSVAAGNVCHDVGMIEKQSSCWFQAKTASSRVAGNVFYNAPRALVNMNDGFGGGTVIEGNALWNSCRESGDHGAINTWDRTPYLTLVRTGEASLIPAYNNVTGNLIISNYNSFDGIDNDDGSSYYDIGSNVFYMHEGLKSDYHGHGKLYHDNINIGAGVCCFQFGFIKGRDACRGGACPGGGDVPGANEFYKAGHTDQCYNNRCIQRVGGSWVNGAYAILWGCNASVAGCAPHGHAVMQMHGNKIYQESGRRCPFSSGCDVSCGMDAANSSMLSLKDFQAKCNRGLGSEILPLPTDMETATWCRDLLGL